MNKLKMFKINSRIFEYSFIRKFKIKTRLIIAFLLISILPLAITGIFSYFISRNAINTKIQAYTQQLVSSLGSNIENAASKIIFDANEISVSKDIQDRLESYTMEDDYGRQEIRSFINQYLQSKFTLSSTVLYAEIVSKDEETFFYGASTGIEAGQIGAYLEKAKGSERLYHMTVWGNGQGSNIVIVKPIISYNTGENLGYLDIRLKESALSGMYQHMLAAEGSEMLILDSDGTVISSSKIEETGQKYSDAELAKKVYAAGDKENVFEHDNNLIVSKSISDNGWCFVALTPMSYINKDSNKIALLLTLIILGCMALIFVFSVIISKSIANPLSKLVTIMNESKSGNLTSTLKDDSGDEIAGVINNFNDMVANIRLLIKKVHDSSGDVLGSSELISDSLEKSLRMSEQVAIAVQEIANGASQQAEDAMKSADNMSMLSNGFNKSKSEIDTMSLIVTDTKKISENALDAVKALREKSDETQDAFSYIVNEFYSLNEDMKQIKSIINVISGITEQTNLLSLNASIEAARAGEAGRGFAVVAEEVKKLADESKNASTIINEITSSVLEKTQKAVGTANSAKETVNKQVAAVLETDSIFRTIYSGMENVAQNIRCVINSMNEAMNYKDLTQQSIESIAAVNEQAAASTEEVAASTEEQTNNSQELSKHAISLHEMAQELENSVKMFKID